MVHEQPAIAIEGAKAVGKTMSALRRATSVLALDDPAEVTLLAADRSRLRHLPTPVLIDEWQKYPPVWDMVRRAVDGGAPPGSFLLTGSATPHGASTHSGAGRIVRLRMRPMSLAERGLVPPVVSVAELMTGARRDLGCGCQGTRRRRSRRRSRRGSADWLPRAEGARLSSARQQRRQAVPSRARRVTWGACAAGRSGRRRSGSMRRGGWQSR